MRILIEPEVRSKLLCILKHDPKDNDEIFNDCIQEFKKDPYEFYASDYTGVMVIINLNHNYDLNQFSSYLKVYDGQVIFVNDDFIAGEIITNKWNKMVDQGLIPSDIDWWKESLQYEAV